GDGNVGLWLTDLKPDNVMLVPDSEVAGGERVKILDFGIAKVITDYSGPGAEEFKTNTGLVLGTATYMAPEQCKGAGDVSEKADVYSLAVVMYRMCCGKVPFRAEGPGEVMAMHIFSQPQPLRDIEPRIPEPLAAIIHRMMSKEPHERPTMAQVAGELEKMAQTATAAAVVPAAKSTGSSGAVPIPGSASAPTVDAPPSAGSSGASAASQPSTIGTAVGQSGSAPAVTVGSRSRLGLWFAMVLVLGGTGVSIPYALKMYPQLFAAKAKPVYWNISCSPVAQVVRKSDGQAMGPTPWTHSVLQGTGRQLFVLRAEGYRDQEVWFDESSSATQTVVLQAEPKPSEVVVDGGTAGSAPVIVIQDGGLPGSTGGPDGGTKPGAAIARQPIGTPSAQAVEKVGNGVATVPGVKTGRPAAMGNPGNRTNGNSKLPRLGSDAELLKDDDIAILKDD
ncbi:MAG TPA: serine/threonine-protein kinase, partial [Pseudomonadota bacterium]|nr:serine/threonine-protein kinase [Pseudomonadota bacterium]